MELRGGVATGVLQPATEEAGTGGERATTGGKKSYKGGVASESATIFLLEPVSRRATTGTKICYERQSKVLQHVEFFATMGGDRGHHAWEKAGTSKQKSFNRRQFCYNRRAATASCRKPQVGVATGLTGCWNR